MSGRQEEELDKASMCEWGIWWRFHNQVGKKIHIFVSFEGVVENSWWSSGKSPCVLCDQEFLQGIYLGFSFGFKHVIAPRVLSS